MISNEFKQLLKQHIDAGVELDQMVREETHGRVGFCAPGWGQLWVDQSQGVTYEELVELVGPLKYTGRGAGGTKHYEAYLDGVRVSIVMDADFEGGVADDVSSDT